VDLRLYVVNHTPRCLVAYENLVRICEAHAGLQYRIAVIDLLENPAVAREDQITAIPTLIRLPRKEGTRKIIGTLADERRVIGELGLAGRSDGRFPAPAAQ
jgi:circadian clock protein KaiB